MSKVNLNISVPDPGKFAGALKRAEEAGLAVTRSFEDLGVASGSIDRSSLPRLRRIEGLEIEEDRAVSVPTPPR